MLVVSRVAAVVMLSATSFAGRGRDLSTAAGRFAKAPRHPATGSGVLLIFVCSKAPVAKHSRPPLELHRHSQSSHEIQNVIPSDNDTGGMGGK